MKKFFVFLSVLLAIFVTTSCNQLMPSRKITVSLDTTIYQGFPVTQPLYSCSTGERRPYDKLLGMQSVPVKISLKKDTVISGNLLPVANGQKKTSNDSDLDWLLPILGGLFALLMLVALLMLAFWALRELWRMLFGPRPTGQGGDTTNAKTPVATQQPTKKEEAEDPIVTDSARRDEIFNHQLLMAESLVAKQQIHKIIQKTESQKDGSWKSEITIETKNEKNVTQK